MYLRKQGRELLSAPRTCLRKQGVIHHSRPPSIICVYISIYLSMYIYIYTHIHTHAHTHTHIHIYRYISLSLSIYIYIYITSLILIITLTILIISIMFYYTTHNQICRHYLLLVLACRRRRNLGPVCGS